MSTAKVTTKKTANEIEIEPIEIKTAKVYIVGDTDLVLHKTNARYERECIAVAEGKSVTKQAPNQWEDILTSVRWNIPFPVKDTYKELNEEHYGYMLQNAKPCLSAFGLYKSFGDAVVRNEIDAHATKIKNAITVISPNGLIPVSFTEARIEDVLMPLRKGGHTVATLNMFSGWKADFVIRYTENVYRLNQLINFINLAGFGLGIGSCRTSGYGRYHVENVE